jgi:hypothetical protein
VIPVNGVLSRLRRFHCAKCDGANARQVTTQYIILDYEFVLRVAHRRPTLRPLAKLLGDANPKDLAHCYGGMSYSVNRLASVRRYSDIGHNCLPTDSIRRLAEVCSSMTNSGVSGELNVQTGRSANGAIAARVPD